MLFVAKSSRSAIIQIRLVYIWLLLHNNWSSSSGLQEADEKEGISAFRGVWVIGIGAYPVQKVRLCWREGSGWKQDKTKHTLQLSCALHTMTTRGHLRNPAIILHAYYSVNYSFSITGTQKYQFEICIIIFKYELCFKVMNKNEF